jgi:hypothetical protein
MTILTRSSITTFLSTLLTLLPVSFFVVENVPWFKAIFVATIIAILRTLVAYIDPRNPEMGRISKNSSVESFSNGIKQTK